MCVGNTPPEFTCKPGYYLCWRHSVCGPLGIDFACSGRCPRSQPRWLMYLRRQFERISLFPARRRTSDQISASESPEKSPLRPPCLHHFSPREDTFFDNEIVCFVATLVSLAIAARAPLPLASAEKASQVFAAVLARLATVDAKTSVEESPFAVQKRLRLLSTSRVPILFVATSVLLATAARSPLPLDSGF